MSPWTASESLEGTPGDTGGGNSSMYPKANVVLTERVEATPGGQRAAYGQPPRGGLGFPAAEFTVCGVGRRPMQVFQNRAEAKVRLAARVVGNMFWWPPLWSVKPFAAS